MMDEKGILVAGVGNVFHGDDAFGVVLAQEMSKRRATDGVVVSDFGIRSYDLAFAMLDGFDTVILVDAVHRGGEPGTVYLLDPAIDAVEAGRSVVGGHGMTPQTVLGILEAFGGFGGAIYVVGCEPASLESEGGRIGLSDPVQAAVPVAISMIEDLIERIQDRDMTVASVEAHESHIS